MDQLQDLIAKSRSANEGWQFKYVIDLLTDDLLEKHANANLWAEKAVAFKGLDDIPEATRTMTKALTRDWAFNSTYKIANNDLIDIPRTIENYSQLQLIATYENRIDANPNSPENFDLAVILYNRRKYREAITHFSKAVESGIEVATALLYIGYSHSQLEEFEKAIDAFRKVINSTEEASVNSFAYYQIGTTLMTLKKNYEAIENFNRAIELNPQRGEFYFNLAVLYHSEKKYKLAIDNYNLALKWDPNQNNALYNLGFAYFDNQQYDLAAQSLRSYIERFPDKREYMTSNALAKLGETYKKQNDNSYSEIYDLVAKIKEILLFEEDCITHYTTLFVTKLLILKEDSFLWLSEGTFLNDPSEGSEFFKLFDNGILERDVTSSGESGVNIRQFASKPFIGSYVPISKHNDLTLWRMYGKENKDEAKGCSITMSRSLVLRAITENLIIKPARLENQNNQFDSDFSRDAMTSMIEEENFNFYRVAYKTPSLLSFFVPSFDDDKTAELTESIKDLVKKVNNYYKTTSDKPKSQLEMKELLNDIAYLFKTDEYRFESEVRLVVKGTGFEKFVDEKFDPPRVYVKLARVPPLVTHLTLGPKVERAEEYAATFHYKLQNDGYDGVEISMSSLPFK
jgi:tetratricopeptide (TPR) repeat protein